MKPNGKNELPVSFFKVKTGRTYYSVKRVRLYSYYYVRI
jgi:hypothetical protein